MQHVPEDPLCQATSQMQLQDTIKNQYLNSEVPVNFLTNPKDLITNVHVPMNLRITNPPSTVLISGIPLCFAYKAYSLTNTLAATANTS
jgi:hypothetical protein